MLELLIYIKYYQGHQIKETEMGEECSARCEIVNTYRILVGKSGGRRSFGRLKRRSEVTLK
jgi:hypothetical protein